MPINFPKKSRENAFRADMFDQMAVRFPDARSPLGTALAACAKGYRELGEQLKRISCDETVTAGRRTVKAARVARSKMSPLLESLEAAAHIAAEHSGQLEAQTAAAYSPPQNPPYPMVHRHQEIRSYVRSLPMGGKLTLLEEARKANDQDTLIAIASVQPFLSGVDTQLQEMVRGQLIEAKVPEQAKCLKGLKEQLQLADQFKATMLQSVADLPEVDFLRADELVATAQEDAGAD